MTPNIRETCLKRFTDINKFQNGINKVKMPTVCNFFFYQNDAKIIPKMNIRP